MTFENLFTRIEPEDIKADVFTLAGKVLPVITAGSIEHYNSMTGSGGGMGVLFKKPVAWSVLRTDRYTLELILKEQTYTISYFTDRHREQVIFLGSKSGRDSRKMEEVELTGIRTPSGNISFEEARLIIECRLIQITTPDIDDFYTQEAKDYLEEAYKTTTDIRKYVFGEIKDVWSKL